MPTTVQQPYRKKTDKKSIPQFFNAETTLATISNDSPDEDAASANSDAIRKSEETKEMTERGTIPLPTLIIATRKYVVKGPAENALTSQRVAKSCKQRIFLV